MVKIYTKPGCPYCAAAKRDLRSREVDFEEIDVAGDADALAEMERLSGARTVPVIVEGGTITVGFNGGG